MRNKRKLVGDDDVVDYLYAAIHRSADSWKECVKRLGKRRLVLVDEDEDDDVVLDGDSWRRRIQELIDRNYYFDRLPDDVVGSILDKLGLKDAARTALFSRRFRHVSKNSISHRKNLDFEDPYRATPCSKFLEFVNQILNNYTGPKADSLRIAFDAQRIEAEVRDDIDMSYGFEEWLTFARDKSVRSLDINLNFSEMTKELLLNPRFPTFDGFDKLISLSLNLVRVDDAVLERGLKSHLVNLESLSIQFSNFLENAVVASPKLKRLEIRSCLKIRSIAIEDAPNLELFAYDGPLDQVVIVNLKLVPNLSHFSLGGGAITRNSMAELAKVEKLDKLELRGPSYYQVSVFTPQFAMFEAWDRLTTLSMKSVKVGDADIRHLMNLESLCIQDAPDLRVVLVRSEKLKRLEIRCCSSIFGSILSIDIDSAPNLEYLRYEGPSSVAGQIVLRVKDAPKLVNIYSRESRR